MTELSPATAIGLAFVIGLCVGSFLNVVIHRLPRMLERDWRAQCAELAGGTPAAEAPYNLVVPRSACPSCGHRIAAWENVPLVSWLALRGKCAGCKAAISPRYPIVELIGGVLAAAAIWKFGPTPAGLGACVLLWALDRAHVHRLRHAAPARRHHAAAPLGRLAGPARRSSARRGSPTFVVGLQAGVIGAMAGYLSLWLVYWIFKLVRGKEGMGYGDFKLLAALGAWLGWQLLVPIILLSSVVGAIIGIALMAFRGRHHSVPLAFGPYLAIAGSIALFYGPQLLALQKSFLR